RDEAITELEAARRIYPRYSSLARSPHLLLADLYVEKKQPAEAIAVLREHTRIHNNSFKGFTQLGTLLAAQGQHAEAAVAFLGAIYIDPFSIEPHLAAARAFEAIGSHSRAAAEYTVATHIDKRHLPALVGRARCLAAAGDKDEARKALEAVRELDPANAELPAIERTLRD
ncbi:tetratricopeptide repeat protein, partial [bacterium]|nr:tetratricopeptide repeat protein [bacterium]